MRHTAALLAAAAGTAAATKCPDLASLRSGYVAAHWSAPLANGLFYENRYVDLAQIGASCQRMNKTAQPDGSITETYEVFYGPVPFPLPLVYAATNVTAVSNRYMALFPEVTFPSVVVDVDVAPDGSSYNALTEFLCWELPLGLDPYIELRISTRSPAPNASYLDGLEARARALGVPFGQLTSVNFTGCPAWHPDNATAVVEEPRTATPTALPPWAQTLLRAGANKAPLEAERARRAATAAVTPVAANSSDVVLPGTRPGLPQLAFIFIQGAEVTAAAYTTFLQAVQAAVTDFDVIVGAPAAVLDVPDPLEIGLDVRRIVAAMQQQAGLNLSTAKVVFGGHSLGTVVLQTWLANASASGGWNGALDAVVLTGGYLLRSVRAAGDDSPAFRAPTLSLVGELDGLCRVSRLAESYWHQQTRAGAANATLAQQFPVLIVPGMSHGQFATFDGPPPSEVATYDLQPEVSTPAAQAAAAQHVADFLGAVLAGSPPAAAALAAAQADSAAFLAPLVDALVYERNYGLLPACYDNPYVPGVCWLFSNFSQDAQAIMSAAAGTNGSASEAYGMVVTDAMHPVDDLTPIHLPAVNALPGCGTWPAAPGCTLNGSTVTQNSYDPLFWDADIALYPSTAHEVKLKMTSRQNALVQAGDTAANFTLTDGPFLIANINAMTFQRALAAAGNATRARYLAKGLPLVFGQDVDAWGGPAFTYGSLQFGLANGTNGAPFVWVNSTTLRTPLNFIIQASAGFHYGLMLSPARALEWLYVDSLRSFVLQ